MEGKIRDKRAVGMPDPTTPVLLQVKVPQIIPWETQWALTTVFKTSRAESSDGGC
jgi:hypothetical protein